MNIVGKTISKVETKETWREDGNVEELILTFTDGTSVSITASTDAEARDGSTDWLNFTTRKDGKFIDSDIECT